MLRLTQTIFLATGAPGLVRAQLGSPVEAVAAGYDVRALAVDPGDPHNVFAGTQGSGVLRSEDAGRTWRPSGLDGRIVKSLAISPAGPQLLFAGTKPAAVFVSCDAGRSWEEVAGFRRVRRWFWFSPAEAPFSAYVQAIAISPGDPNVVMAGIEAGAVVRSADRGATWQGHRRGSLRDCHQLIAHPSTDGCFYEGGAAAGGAFSLDGGDTWQRPAGLDRKYGWAVAADPADPRCWYVSVSPGVRAHSDHADAAIFRSRGGDWERLEGGLPVPMTHMPYALLAGPAPGQLLAGLSSGELWETGDHGDTWNRLPLRLPYIERCLVRLLV